MAELGRNIFWSLITEIIIVGLAIVLKDDKRKVVVALAVGTLLAGFIGFGQPIYLFIVENAFSFESISNSPNPSSEFAEPFLQAQVAEKVNSIYTYRTRGTVEATTAEGNILSSQIESEYVRPDKSRTLEISQAGKITETIVVGDQYCSRQGEAQWHCDSAFILDEIQQWVEIVMGKAGLDTITIVDHGMRTEAWGDKECRLYFKTQTYSDANAEETYALCIDPSTLLPVQYLFSGKWPDNPGAKAVTREFDVFDINEPIDISLPTP